MNSTFLEPIVDNQRYARFSPQNVIVNSGRDQNINYGRDQNINHRRDQIIASDVVVFNGDFVKIFDPLARNPHRTLWEAVGGVSASHNAEQQYERGECLEETRVELRRMIHEWGRAGGEGSPLCWLTGAAGVGKTAIAMSVAKDFEKEGTLVSSFFFFRSDPKRNNPQALWLTIVHGLISTMPFMRRRIERRISEDPQILKARLEHQFRELVINPFLNPVLGPSSWQRSLWTSLLQFLCLMLSSVMLLDVVWGLMVTLIPLIPDALVPVPDIVIIDGLDECSDEATQRRILDTIRDAVQQSPHFPLRFLICSRPEAWIKEAFNDECFRTLSKVILVDKAFEDIIRYCHHHFREIVDDPKYSQVEFPNPWPSQGDLETLVDRSSSQFIYVVTVFKLITFADNHPIDQLRLILENSPNTGPGASRFHELDTLYLNILKASLTPEKARDVLGAILILPDYLEPTPAHIELVLGLPPGQVALTLRRMHSVLHINGRADKIQLHHTSFRDFLVEQNRSQDFYIDLAARRHVVAQQWLQGLTTSKMLAYSFDQLYDNETRSFFTEWRSLCTSLLKPTRSLLQHLQNVDLASVFLCIYAKEPLSPVEPLLLAHNSFIDEESIFRSRRHQSYLKEQGPANTRPRLASRDFLQWSHWFESCHSWVEDYHNRGEHHSDDLVKGLLVKLAKLPQCFHLILGVGRRDDATRWIIRLVSECRSYHSTFEEVGVHNEVKRSGIRNLRLTDCVCDRTKIEHSDDPGHLAYQEVCMELLKDFISDLDRSDYASPFAFLNVVASSLLEHCRPDAELLSLCRNFLDSAQRCSALRCPALRPKDSTYSSVQLLPFDPQTMLLERIETIKFPVDLAEGVEALKEQILALDEWLDGD
ncbi:hypothetical protein PQX77_005162 [Marasmius sp. AFHP31]|nr:hypothetical protein PQX77_005162 [Marasmius sp. AFHP31]